MSSRKRASSIAARMRRFLKAYFSSKLGLTGLILLLIFIFLATLAPLLTPYDPVLDTNLGQPGLPPTWLLQFTGQQVIPYTKIPTHYDLNRPQDLSEWQTSATPAPPASVSIGYNGTDGYIPADLNTTVPPGSAQVNYSRQSSVTNVSSLSIARLVASFSWPSTGVPSTFDAGLYFKANLVGAIGYSVAMYVGTPRGTLYTLYNSSYEWVAITNKPGWHYDGPAYAGNFTYSQFQNWNEPYPPVDSRSIRTQAWFNQSIVAAEAQIFQGPGTYSFILQVSFNDTGTTTATYGRVTLDDAFFEAKGNSWGLLGTDIYGRDQWSQLIYGARQSLIIGIVSAIIAVGIGLLVGVVAGYAGGATDNALMRLTDVFLTIPFLPLVLVFTVVLASARQNSILNLIIILGILGWSGVARIIRSQVLTVKEYAYVEAAKAIGAGDGHIISKHIIPNVSPLIWVQLALFVPGAIVTEAAVSFLGLGDPNSMSWGIMLYWAEQAQQFTEWWRFIPPGLCIALVSLSFVMIGFALDGVLNPRLRAR